MRTTFFLLPVLLLCCLDSHGQTPKAGYSYCKVDAQTYNRKTSIAVDYGNYNDMSKITGKLVTDTLLDKVNSFKNEILMINYMNDIGWECFSIVSTFTQGQWSIVIVYYFRKPKTGL